MTITSSARSLRNRFSGALLEPGDAAYDTSRRVWNGAVDRHPALIARATGLDDVLAAVRHARELGLPLSVRGGGHSVLGHAVRDGGLLLDLSLMSEVRVDPAARTAHAAGGATWGGFDAATQRHGLATPGGSFSSTGVGGVTLSGGFGHLLRARGLTVDNLRAVDLVTAAGEHVRVDDAAEAELMWGLRGGGGNFGVAAGLEYDLHPTGPLVLGGPVFWPLDQAREVLGALDQLAPDLPDEVGVGLVLGALPPMPFLPPDAYGAPALGLVLTWFGEPREGEQVLRPLRQLGTPYGDQVRLMPYRAIQSLLDGGAGPGNHSYWRSHQLSRLDGAVLDVVLDAAAHRPAPTALLNGWVVGGTASRVPADATAVGARPPGYELRFIAVWSPDDPEPARHRGWVRDSWDRLVPHSTGQFATFLSDEGPAGVRRAYRDGFDRLLALKRQWDPDNVFDLNNNINPQQGAQS